MDRRGFLKAGGQITVAGAVGAALKPANALIGLLGGAPASAVANPNPIGIVFPAGGQSNLDGEGFPIFQDQIKAARYFSTIANASVVATMDSAGWPSEDFQVILYEGSSQTWASGTYYCGYISKGNGPTQFGGTEVIAPATAANNCTISSITYNSTTKLVTFQLTTTGIPFGFQITSTTGGVTGVYAYIPGYVSNASYGYQDCTPANVNAGVPLFTTQAINLYKPFAWIRWVEWQNAWWNTATTSWATRNTSANTKTNKGWTTTNPQSEGYPVEWAVAFNVACGNGGWFHVPLNDDGTYATGLASYLASEMPTGVKIWVETANELWNAGGEAGGQTFINTAASFSSANPSLLDYGGFAVSNITSQNCSGGQGTISGTVFTCTTAPTSGTYQIGMFLSGSGIQEPCYISSLGTGTGGTGTYNISNPNSNSVPTAEAIAGYMTTVTTSSAAGSNPLALAQLTVEGAGGMTQINGLVGDVSSTGGSSGAWTATYGIDSSAFSAYTSGGTSQDALLVSHRYLGYRCYLNGVAFSSAFGARFGTDANIVMAWQQSQQGQVNDALQWLVTKHTTPSNYVHWLAIAPYLTRDNTLVPASYGTYSQTKYINSNDTVAQIEGELTANATYHPKVDTYSENYLGMALHYGLKGLITYENGWETGVEGSGVANIGAAIIDSGMQSVVNTQIQKDFDGGMSYITWYKGGADQDGTNKGANYNLDDSYADLILATPSTSPRLLALKGFFSGSYVPQRNVLSTSTYTIPASNYYDGDSTLNGNPSLTNNKTAYMAGTNGYTAWTLYAPTSGTYSLAAMVTTTEAVTTDVEVDGSVVASNLNISTGLTNSRVALATVTLSAGWHEMTIGNGTYYSGITFLNLVN